MNEKYRLRREAAYSSVSPDGESVPRVRIFANRAAEKRSGVFRAHAYAIARFPSVRRASARCKGGNADPSLCSPTFRQVIGQVICVFTHISHIVDPSARCVAYLRNREGLGGVRDVERKSRAYPDNTARWKSEALMRREIDGVTARKTNKRHVFRWNTQVQLENGQ